VKFSHPCHFLSPFFFFQGGVPVHPVYEIIISKYF
jgi:hypothetical protein